MQLQEADLLRKCIMLRDGLMLLPDCFTANGICAVIDYLCCDGSLMYAWGCTIEFFYSFFITLVLHVPIPLHNLWNSYYECHCRSVKWVNVTVDFVQFWSRTQQQAERQNDIQKTGNKSINCVKARKTDDNVI